MAAGHVMPEPQSRDTTESLSLCYAMAVSETVGRNIFQTAASMRPYLAFSRQDAIVRSPTLNF